MDEIISWLLEDSSPEVKHRAVVELLGKPNDDPETRRARGELLGSEILIGVMKKFSSGKKWEDYAAFSSLAEFGLTRDDVEIDPYVNRIIEGTNFEMHCGKGLLLRNFVALGYYGDERVKGVVADAFSVMRDDGTFKCLSKTKKENDTNLPGLACYRQTTTYLLLAAELMKIGATLPQFGPLVDFYLKYEVAYRPDGSFVIEEMARTFYPVDCVKNGLQMILYALSVLGAASRPECARAFELLENKKGADGKYILENSLTKPYLNVGKTGKPNKWVTLYALLSEKYRSE